MSIITLTQDNFKKEIQESTGVLIIDFWASWCGPCMMLHPIYEELEEKFKDKVKFFKVNVDEQPELTQKFEIQAMPTIIILKDNKELDRFIGLQQPSKYENSLNNALK